jgi:hypothetical protein
MCRPGRPPPRMGAESLTSEQRWSANHPPEGGADLHAEPIRISLEVEPGADPVQGSLRVQDGTRQRFWGWLQLSALLNAAAAGGGPAATQAGGPVND